MLKKESHGLQWYQFDLLTEQKKLAHGIFTRHGGASKAPYDTLNFIAKSPKDIEAVSLNLRKVRDVLNSPPFFSAQLEHGDQIHALTDPIKKVIGDGIATDQKHFALLTTHADCQAALFYDPIRHILANIHCGWRGNVKNIYSRTVTFLQEKYNCKPANLLVGISPSLGPSHSEFIHYKTEWPEQYWTYQHQPFYFDLWQISKEQLLAAGILEHHIEIAKICTYENAKDFFSFRREKECGRNGTIAYLKS